MPPAGAEMVNGQATQKWEYTNTDGEARDLMDRDAAPFPRQDDG